MLIALVMSTSYSVDSHFTRFLLCVDAIANDKIDLIVVSVFNFKLEWWWKYNWTKQQTSDDEMKVGYEKGTGTAWLLIDKNCVCRLCFEHKPELIYFYLSHGVVLYTFSSLSSVFKLIVHSSARKAHVLLYTSQFGVFCSIKASNSES